MTQPGVTQHIHFLENYYGVKLFEYDGRTLFKTKNAERLKRYFDGIKAEEVDIRESFVSDETVHMTIGATKTIGEFVITPEVRAFLHKPNHNLDLIIDNTENLLRMLAKTEIEQLNSQNNQREIIPVDWKEVGMIVRNDPDRVRDYVNRLSEVTLDRSLSYHDRIIAFYGQALLTDGTEQALVNEASRLYEGKDYANALKKAKEALEINPLNLSALNKAGSSIVMLMESGDTSVTSDDAMYYFNVAMRIYNTIAITGYGNEEHPFFITTVADEYAFVRNYLEIYKIEGQALINHCENFACLHFIHEITGKKLTQLAAVVLCTCLVLWNLCDQAVQVHIEPAHALEIRCHCELEIVAVLGWKW